MLAFKEEVWGRNCCSCKIKCSTTTRDLGDTIRETETMHEISAPFLAGQQRLACMGWNYGGKPQSLDVDGG